MPPFDCRVEVFALEGIVDPASRTIARHLPDIDKELDGKVIDFRIGKLTKFTLEVDTIEIAQEKVESLAKNFLANLVIEKYTVHVEPVPGD